MSTNTIIGALVAGCLAIAPFSASAADANFPRQSDPGSIDRVVVAAINEVELAKRMLVAYGTYDQKDDPAKLLVIQIAGRGHNMQRQETSDAMQLYSIRYIADRVKRIQDQVVNRFQAERSAYCVATTTLVEGEDAINTYEAAPGTSEEMAAMFCRFRPDWKRYQAEALVFVSPLKLCKGDQICNGYQQSSSEFETEVGSTAQ